MIMRIERYISMSDFAENPVKVPREAQSQPIAVLRNPGLHNPGLHNHEAAFYLIDPTSFVALIDQVEDAQLMPILRHRIANSEKGNYKIVDIDTI